VYVTTVAFKDGILASDSLMTWVTEGGGGTKYKAPKIFRRNADLSGITSGSEPVLFGFAGETYAEANFLKWVWQGCQVDGPIYEALLEARNDLDVICVTKREALVLDGAGAIVIKDAPFLAIGSGRNCALAAMEAGCSAERAVEIACKYDPCSDFPVVAEKL
jgi:hypothetical protein